MDPQRFFLGVMIGVGGAILIDHIARGQELAGIGTVTLGVPALAIAAGMTAGGSGVAGAAAGFGAMWLIWNRPTQPPAVPPVPLPVAQTVRPPQL